MRYRCLILDHDDTVTDGTRTIHYPAYIEVMRHLRPEMAVLSFEEWMLKNFDPGIIGFLTGELGMDDDELRREYEIWRSFSQRSDPPFFPGVLDLLGEFRKRGGLITVVSHSEADIIDRNYQKESRNTLNPDAIFGWELPPHRRKPSPWPVEAIIDRFGLSHDDVLVVDDLKPGVDMARSAGVSVAGAGWAYSICDIREYLKKTCDFYFETVADFADHLFSEPA